MTAFNELDDQIRGWLLDRILDTEESDEEMAERLGIGAKHLSRVLDGEEPPTTRDIMLILASGEELTLEAGALSGRRGGRYIRPMVWRPPKCPTRIEYAGGSDLPVGIDVTCESVAGQEVIVKLSAGVAADVTRWVQEHRPEWTE